MGWGWGGGGAGSKDKSILCWDLRQARTCTRDTLSTRVRRTHHTHASCATALRSVCVARGPFAPPLIRRREPGQLGTRSRVSAARLASARPRRAGSGICGPASEQGSRFGAPWAAPRNRNIGVACPARAAGPAEEPAALQGGPASPPGTRGGATRRGPGLGRDCNAAGHPFDGPDRMAGKTSRFVTTANGGRECRGAVP